MVRGHMFDGIVALVACDKTIPGAAMALLRLNIPGVVLYGGTIMPGKHNGRDIRIQDVFEAVGAHACGRITDAELLDIEDHACPGAGACGGQFTANHHGHRHGADRPLPHGHRRRSAGWISAGRCRVRLRRGDHEHHPQQHCARDIAPRRFRKSPSPRAGS
jgi:hypothetical protein